MAKTYFPQCRAIIQVMLDGYGPPERDSDPIVIPVHPKAATVIRNSYKQADSWELLFDADDFPFDPRLVRAGQVEIFMYAPNSVTDDQRLIDRTYVDIENDPEAQPPVAPNPKSQLGLLKQGIALDKVRRERGAKLRKDRFTGGEAPMIIGLFDNHSVEYSNNGRWVTLSGQDYTDFLNGRQWPPKPNGRERKIPVGKRIDRIMTDIIREVDTRNKLQLSVENLDPELLPVVGPAETRSNRRGIPIEQGTSYWDVLTKLASRYGFITFVRGLDVVLTRPQNLGEDLAYKVKHLAFGKNIESLYMERSLGKEKAPAQVLSAYDPRQKKTIYVDYPPGSFAKVRANKKDEDGDRAIRKDVEYQLIEFGIADQALMRAAAETRYNLLGRPERTLRFTTRDLDDLLDASLMDLNAGDAVTVVFEEFNISRKLLADKDVSTERKIQHLISRGYNDAVAAVLARQYEALRQIERPLRVREATYNFSDTEGIQIEAELQDFIVVDGIRDADAKRPRKNERKQRRKDGTPIGQSAEKEAARKRQFGDGGSA